MIYLSTFRKFTRKKMKLSGSIGLRHTSFGERRVTDKVCYLFFKLEKASLLDPI